MIIKSPIDYHLSCIYYPSRVLDGQIPWKLKYNEEKYSSSENKRCGRTQNWKKVKNREQALKVVILNF